MSSIASNSEDLILNADGGSSTVKFKIDGTEKASISSAGAFTSTTIDATKLTGALPAISGANLTGITTMAAGGTMTGDLLIHKQNPVITFKPNGANNAMKLMFKDENDDVKFTLGYQDSVSAFRLSSTDINATDYIHVKTDGKVGFGTATPQGIITVKVQDTAVSSGVNFLAEAKGSAGSTGGYYFASHDLASPRKKQAIVNKKNTGGSSGDYGVGSLLFLVDSNTDDADVSEADAKLEITSDGRGLSQFTAKAWAKLNGTGTPSFYDSHNCSSITDNATGSYTVNFANNTANSNYAALGNAGTTGNPQGLRTVNVYSYGSGGVTFGISYVDGTGQDVPLINIAIFGD